jgi:hypothetical protein
MDADMTEPTINPENAHLLTSRQIGREASRMLVREMGSPSGFQDDHVTAFLSSPSLILLHRVGYVELSVKTTDLAKNIDEFAERFIAPAVLMLATMIRSKR